MFRIPSYSSSGSNFTARAVCGMDHAFMWTSYYQDRDGDEDE